MIALYKVALAPALLLQAARLRKAALRLPEAQGPRSGTVGAAETPPLRLLFIGDSSAAGVGVDWQHEAMPQQAAEFVATELRCPVRWELIARTGVDTREAAEMLRSHAPAPADIVVSALGVNDVTCQRSAKGFVADYIALLDAIRDRTGAYAAVASGLPPLHVLPAVPQPLRWYLGQCAARLDEALERLCAQRSDMRYVSLRWAKAHEMARDKFHPGKTQYREWARRVAQEVVSLRLASA